MERKANYVIFISNTRAYFCKTMRKARKLMEALTCERTLYNYNADVKRAFNLLGYGKGNETYYA
jgi:hypothetical protein